MGWSSGSSLMSDCIRVLKREVPDAKVRQRIYVGMIKAFESEDADTLDECHGDDPAFLAADREVNPGMFEDEEPA